MLLVLIHHCIPALKKSKDFVACACTQFFFLKIRSRQRFRIFQLFFSMYEAFLTIYVPNKFGIFFQQIAQVIQEWAK